jgi:uncharacterized membrane protein YdbT with pleckstrin-like domain
MEKNIKELIVSSSGENIKKIVRRHWFIFATMMFAIFMIFILPLILVAISIKVFPAFFQGVIVNIFVFGLFVYILLLAGAFLISYIKYYFDLVILTDKRIIDIQQVTLFSRNVEELELKNIQNVSSDLQGIFATFLNYGRVTVETAGNNPNFVFNTIPNPQAFARELIKLSEKAKEKARIKDSTQISESISQKINGNSTPKILNEGQSESVENNENPRF